MTDQKKIEGDDSHEILQQQLTDFARSIRRAVAARHSTVIVTFDDNYTRIATSEFRPDQDDIWPFIWPLLSLAQSTFDLAETSYEIIVRLPNGTERAGWSKEVEVIEVDRV